MLTIRYLINNTKAQMMPLRVEDGDRHLLPRL